MANVPTKIFTFTAGPNGFAYTPPGDWAYNHADRIRFQSTSGPFRLSFRPKQAPSVTFNPLGGPLSSVENPPGTHAVETTVQDGLNPAQRQSIIDSNKSPAHPQGFIARYRYAIEMLDGDGDVIASDDTHNGTYDC